MNDSPAPFSSYYRPNHGRYGENGWNMHSEEKSETESSDNLSKESQIRDINRRRKGLRIYCAAEISLKNGVKTCGSSVRPRAPRCCRRQKNHRVNWEVVICSRCAEDLPVENPWIIHHCPHCLVTFSGGLISSESLSLY